MRLLAAIGAVVLLAAACTSSPKAVPDVRVSIGCADGQAPCGNGCRPTGSVCCDDGTGATSSYCMGGLGCFTNGARACKANGAASAFCCGPDGATGSVDCPAGQHHCGDTCVALDAPCCSGDACPSATASASCPTSQSGEVLCGICASQGVCHACPSGACCAGDVCANVCVKGNACAPPASPSPACTSSAECGVGKVCVSSRVCIAGDPDAGVDGGACLCNGDPSGTCQDFAARNVAVSACGTCTADYSACCPGTLCVAGQCKASCP